MNAPSEESYPGLRLEKDGPILVCRFDDAAYAPDVHNSIARFASAIGTDRDVRVVVVTGTGSVFNRGGNVKKFASGETDTPALVLRSFETHKEHNGFADVPQPTISMINGDAIGGGLAFALQCDILVAADTARIGFAYSKIGLSPSSPLLALTPLLTGFNFVKEYVFTGELIPAREAERIGLVNHVYPAAELERETMRLAGRIAAASPVSQRFAKLILNKEAKQRLAALGPECEALLALTADMADHEEGKRAFVEHRKPEFPGFRDPTLRRKQS